MAIAVDLNPAYASHGNSVGPSITTAAFSPAAGSLLVVDASIDATTTPSISSSPAMTWTAIGTAQQNGGTVMSWWAYTASAQTGMTVTVDWGNSNSKGIKVTTYTGTASVSAVVSKVQGNSSTNNLTVNSTNTNDGCRIAGAAMDWNANGVPTSTDTEAGFHVTSLLSGVSVHKAANTSGTGVTVPLNFDAAGSSAAQWAYKTYEIVPAAGGGATDLTVAGATQAHTADSPTLTQVHVLTVDAATQAHTAGSPTLTQVHVLTVDGATQSHTAEQVTLSVGAVGLTLAGATQAHTADSPTLTQVHVLTVDGATHAQTAGNVTVEDDGPPTAPAAPFTSGTEVGVPTGTTLTSRSSLGSPTGSTTITLTHPITGATAERTVDVWEGIEFTASITANPSAGETWLFRNCRWEMPGAAFWCVEVDATNGVADQMQPLAVFERCSFQGSGQTGIAVAGHYLWLIGCDVEGMTSASPVSGASDGWQGGAYSIAMDCNIIAGTDTGAADPHSDGFQSTDTGRTVLYHCWMSAGYGPGTNAAVRAGSEFGAVTDFSVYYCAIDSGGWSMQMDGSKGGGAGIFDVKVVGCRWTTTHGFGPVDFVNTTVAEWTDNAYFDGTPIDNPAPGGGDLTVAGATQSHTADNVTLTQVHALTVDSATHAQTAGNVALTQTHVLTVDGATHAQTAEQPTMVGGASLTVADVSQAQTSGSPTLTQLHLLTVDAATQALTSAEVALTQNHVLTVDSATHAHAAEQAAVSITYVLTVDSAVHTQTAAEPTLAQFVLTRGSMGLTVGAASTVGHTVGTGHTMTPVSSTGPTMMGG